MTRKAAGLLPPVAAYSQLAPVYAHVANARRAYIEAVDRIIGAEIRTGSRSLLDAGAGDGSRSCRIARAAGLREIVLLEPSAAMRLLCPPAIAVWDMPAESLSSQQGSFDVITCLWNVLGHIFPAAARIEVLRQFARLASPSGRIFIDLNHRYNLRHYGAVATALRFLRDRALPDPRNGDVIVNWNIEGRRCSTMGHVFTAREFAALSHAAGLTIEKRFVIDYASGELRRRSWEGNLLYVLHPRP